MNNPSYGILGTGFHVPDQVIDNQYFIDQGLETTDEWIKSRTGISSRHVDFDTTTSLLAIESAKKALNNGSIDASMIDLIIVATSTPDYSAFPSTACQVQKALGITRPIIAFDVSAACSGFNYALTIAENFLSQPSFQHGLIIGAECLHKLVDWTDRSTCILFGDGAGAVVVGPVQNQGGILYSRLYSDGINSEILTGDINQKIFMDGRAVFKRAIQVVVPAIEEALQSIEKTVADLAYVIPHQANARIIVPICEQLGLKEDQVIMNIDRFGNTSAASIPIALAESVQNNQFKPGDLIALVGFGSGFTWGINLIQWSDL